MVPSIYLLSLYRLYLIQVGSSMNIMNLHILFLGIAFFQSLFIFIQWFFFRRREYLYYIAYLFSVILFIFFRIYDCLDSNSFFIPEWVNSITYQPLGVFSYWMYLRFARAFLNIPNSNRVLSKHLTKIEYAMILFIVACVLLSLININQIYLRIFYLIGDFILIVISIPGFTLIIRENDILNNFLVAGCILYVAGGCIGMIFNYYINKFDGTNTAVFLGLEIGILLELLLLNTGFLLRNKILHQQVIRGHNKVLKQILFDDNKRSNH